MGCLFASQLQLSMVRGLASFLGTRHIFSAIGKTREIGDSLSHPTCCIGQCAFNFNTLQKKEINLSKRSLEISTQAVSSVVKGQLVLGLAHLGAAQLPN